MFRFKPEREADRRRLNVCLVRDTTIPNFIAMHGGTLRFRKLYMVHSDATVLDADPKDSLDFSIDYHFTQMVEGRSVSRPDYGLVCTVTDDADLEGLRQTDQRLAAAGERRGRAKQGE